MIKFINNIGDFFASNYFDEDFIKKVHDKSGYSADDQKELQKRITPLKDKYYRYKQQVIEGRLRIKDKIYETHQFHTLLLNALGYDGDHHQYNEPFHFSETDVLPVRHKLYRGDQLHLMIMEMQPLIKEGDEEPDGLFEQRYNVEEEEHQIKEQRYHRSQWSRVFQVSEELKISPVIINKAISQLSLLDQHERPQYIMLLAGNVINLIECEKWMRGSYLQFDIEELFSEGTVERKYYSLFYLILAKDMLSPDSDMVLMDQLEEDSHKSAYEVTKDLKEGIIHAVEALANEALYYKKEVLKEELDETDAQFAREVKDDCLAIVYRLLFVFYAESRADLEILPISDSVYQKGYSLEMLRDLELTHLGTDETANGYFFNDSLQMLFQLMSSGYRESQSQAFRMIDGEKISELKNKSFRIRHIDSPLFDNKKLHQLGKVRFRNMVWQDVICQLSLSREQRGKARGRISYANLGINQLGSVYESLLAYRGFYADVDYIEVHPSGKPKEGTLLVQRSRRDDFEDDEVLKDDKDNEVVIKKGTFVYRLSGRDRQKSASYYTPEVLTQCTVKYTLKGILEKVEKGEMKALELLDLKLLEPAMGAAAFHNELINQLAEAYLNYRQKETKQKISPEKYREELQKVKAYIATNNTYGVDLNPTAIELGKLSLWLNVIHKDMETPFFANRLAVGNAVVGAWFKVYSESELKKKWWESAPKMLSFGKERIARRKDQYYHFLLPDKNMVPSAQIKLLKDEHPEKAKRVAEWKAAFCKPISQNELPALQKICTKIDELLEEYYTFQQKLNLQTKNKLHIWGGHEEQEQSGLNLRSYDEKEQLNDQRNRQSAPYYKLKMVMDYWCSLWFWDMRQAEYLPSRQQYFGDIESILQLDLTQQEYKKKQPLGLGQKAEQLTLAMEPSIASMAQEQIIKKTQMGELFDNKERLRIVKDLNEQHRFFHSQLEFIEVFKERGGFDLACGNPPWIKVEFEEKGIMSELFPELSIRNLSAPKVKELRKDFLEDQDHSKLYINEFIETESLSAITNAYQLYGLLKGQQSDLYKNILVNSLDLISNKGYLGLVHPTSVFDDAKGEVLRGKLYSHLKFVFHFRNELKLFAETNDKGRLTFALNIYSGYINKPDFVLISNLFHPSTIDGCFRQDSNGAQTIKILKNDGKYGWNLQSNFNRRVKIDSQFLDILSEAQEDVKNPKLIYLQTDLFRQLIQKIASRKNQKLSSVSAFYSNGFHETSDVGEGQLLIDINENTKVPELENYEFVYNGPHFTILNPIAQSPKSRYNSNNDYQAVNPTQIDESFLPNTKYLPNDENGFDPILKVLEDKNWYENYRWATRAMVGSNSERTLQGAIIPPKSIHINGVLSVLFNREEELIAFSILMSSIVLDFYVKVNGWKNIHPNSIKKLPLGIEYVNIHSLSRMLRLNCLNKYYTPFWERNWQEEYRKDKWSKEDDRLNAFETLTPKWKWETPLRNWYERRQALVEIDVITAMALGLSLEELILIYNVQFPVLQQNEDDTWYDSTGNIVFTCSKGLTGVGVDRPVWETIRDLKAGETYEHTIEKSELYRGKKVTYHAPFDKCDRVEDYKVAWKHFEEVFGEKNVES